MSAQLISLTKALTPSSWGQGAVLAIAGGIGAVAAREIFLNYISPKQNIRPDPLWQTVLDLLPGIRNTLALQSRRIYSLFSSAHTKEEMENYRAALACLSGSKLSDEDLAHAVEVLIRILRTGRGEVQKFSPGIRAQGSMEEKNVHELLLQLLFINDDAFYNQLISRLKAAKDCLQNKSTSLPENQKLTPNDMRFLNISPLSVTMGETIQNLASLDFSTCIKRWRSIKDIAESTEFQTLKGMCLNQRPNGSIFVGYWGYYRAVSGEHDQCGEMVKHLFSGSLCHIGVFVEQEGFRQLSHVNQLTRSHALTPLRNPFCLPFFYGLKLDIHSLLPQDVPAARKKECAEIFETTFLTLASESRTHHPLATSMQHARMLFFGHTNIQEKPLGEVVFPPQGTPLMCSNYVDPAIYTYTRPALMEKMHELLPKRSYRPHPEAAISQSSKEIVAPQKKAAGSVSAKADKAQATADKARATARTKLKCCTVCLDRKIDAAPASCGHAAFCITCLEQLSKMKMPCSICKEPIKKIVKLYFS